MLTHIKDAKNQYTVIIANKSYQFDPSHTDYSGLVECVKTGDHEMFLSLFEVGTVIENWSEGDFRFEDGVLWYEDEQVHDVITGRVVEMLKGGFDHTPMLAFLERLYQNPSYRAINELYTFLQHKFLPITPDGYFLAYKAVQSDFKDKYSGTFDNSVGNTVSISRRKVDDNCDVGCSHGLHVGAIDYVKSYGGAGDKVVICKVDPADVVSVPLDSEHQKVRCCRYEVVGEYAEDLLPAVCDDYYDPIYNDDYDVEDDNACDYCWSNEHDTLDCPFS